jgi:hypothetical protein
VDEADHAAVAQGRPGRMSSGTESLSTEQQVNARETVGLVSLSAPCSVGIVPVSFSLRDVGRPTYPPRTFGAWQSIP